MTTAIHIVLQGKGGVGKSVVSRILLEYMAAKERPYIGFDADPVNQTFAAGKKLNVSAVPLLDGSRIDPNLFDAMMEDIFSNSDKTVILDTGAASFLPFMEYFDGNDMIDVLQDEGFEVFLHTIVTGAAGASDTIQGFVQLAERFGEKCNIVVWENAFFGPVVIDKKPFMDIASVKKIFAEEKVAGRILLDVRYTLEKQAFIRLLDGGQTFDEMSHKHNRGVDTMTRHRLGKLKKKFVALMDPVIGEQVIDEQVIDEQHE